MAWPDSSGSTLIRPSASDNMNDAGFEGDVVIDHICDEIELIHSRLGYLTSGASPVVARLVNLETNYVANSAKGAVNGVASLGANGRVPVAQLGASPTAGFLRYDGTFANPTDPDPAPTLINPSSSTYGAVFDGTTDDRAAIQKCFDSASAVANSGIPVVVVIPQGKVAGFSRKSGALFGLELGDNQFLRIDGRLKWLAPSTVQYGPNGNSGGISMGMIVNRTTGGRTPGRTWRCGIVGRGVLDGNAAGLFAATATGARVLNRTADGTSTGTAFTTAAGGLTGRNNYFVVFRSGANAGKAYRLTVTNDTTGTLATPQGGSAPASSTNVDWDLYGPDVYDGVRFGATDEALVEGITIVDVFGWSGSPPGETAAVRVYSSSDGVVSGVTCTSTARTAMGVRGTTAALHNAYTASGAEFSSSVNTRCVACKSFYLDHHGHSVYKGNEHHLIDFHSWGNGGYDLNWEHTSGNISNPMVGGYLDANGSKNGYYSGLTNLGDPGGAYGGMLINMRLGSATSVVSISNPWVRGQSARAGINIQIGGGNVSSVGATNTIVAADIPSGLSTEWDGATAWLLRSDNTRLGPLTVSSVGAATSGSATMTFTGAHGASVGETGLTYAIDTMAGCNISGGIIAQCQSGISASTSTATMAKLRAAELIRIDPSVMMVGNTNDFGSPGLGYTDRRKDASPTAPRVISGATTLTPADEIVFVDTASASVTVTLPTYYTGNGVPQQVTILKSAAANAVTIQANGSALINGASNKVLTAQYDKVTLLFVPSLSGARGNWFIVA